MPLERSKGATGLGAWQEAKLSRHFPCAGRSRVRVKRSAAPAQAVTRFQPASSLQIEVGNPASVGIDHQIGADVGKADFHRLSPVKAADAISGAVPM